MNHKILAIRQKKQLVEIIRYDMPNALSLSPPDALYQPKEVNSTTRLNKHKSNKQKLEEKRRKMLISVKLSEWDKLYTNCLKFKIAKRTDEINWLLCFSFIHKQHPPLFKLTDIKILSTAICQLPEESIHRKALTFWFAEQFHRIETLPDFDFLQTTTEPYLTPLDCMGIYATAIQEHVRRNLKYKALFNINVENSTVTPADRLSTRIGVTFDSNQILGNNDPHVAIPIFKYGRGPSLQRFYAQITLLQPNICISSQSDLKQDQQQLITDQFTEKLKNADLMSSTGEIVDFESWDLSQIQEMIAECIEQQVGKKLPQSWHHQFDRSQFSKFALLYSKQVDYLGGLSPHIALILFINALVERIDTLELPFYKEMTQTLKNALQISIESLKISKRPKEEQAKKWTDLVEKISNYVFTNDQPVILQTGFPKLDHDYSMHTFYVTLKKTREHIIATLTNGGLNVHKHHKRDEQYKQHEKVHYYYQQVQFSSKDALTLKSFIHKLLSLPYYQSTSFDDFNQQIDQLYNSSQPTNQSYVAQPFGNCTLHNLKYAIKDLFDLSTKDFGILMAALMMGVDHMGSLFGMPSTWDSVTDDYNLTDVQECFNESKKNKIKQEYCDDLNAARFKRDEENKRDEEKKYRRDHIISQCTLKSFCEAYKTFPLPLENLSDSTIDISDIKDLNLIFNDLSILRNVSINIVPGEGGNADNLFDPEIIVDGTNLTWSESSKKLYAANIAMKLLIKINKIQPESNIDNDEYKAFVLKQIKTIFDAFNSSYNLPIPMYNPSIWDGSSKLPPGIKRTELRPLGEWPTIPTSDSTIEFSFTFDPFGQRINVKVKIPKDTWVHIYQRHYYNTFAGEIKERNSFFLRDPYTMISENGFEKLKIEIKELIIQHIDWVDDHANDLNLFGEKTSGYGRKLYFQTTDLTVDRSESHNKKYKVEFTIHSIAPEHHSLGEVFTKKLLDSDETLFDNNTLEWESIKNSSN